MPNRILVFIPAYNCENQIGRVFAKIDQRVQALIEEVVVIDNRSADGTVAAAIKAAASLDTKVTILRNKQNYNLGGSIKRAFLYAIEHQYDYMITLHGDDQADIRDMLPPLTLGEHHRHDLVIGARFHPQSKLEGYSLVRRLGNRTLNVVCSIINRRNVHDLIAGLNCFKMEFFRDRFFIRFPDNLTFDAHVLLYAFHRGAGIHYIPVTWREEDQVSNAKVFRQAFIILKLFARYLVNRGRVFSGNLSGQAEGFTYESEVVFKNYLA